MSRPAVLILGGSGFIGRALQKRLGNQYDLIIADLQRNHSTDTSSMQCHIFDQGDGKQVKELLSKLASCSDRLVGAIHLTAYYDFRNQSDARYTNLEATFPQLLKGLDELLPVGAPILHSSSMAAMAPTNPGIPLSAESTRAGTWVYPKHKLNMEHIITSSQLFVRGVCAPKHVIARAYSQQ